MILVARIRIISFIKEENREKVPFIKEENGVFETKLYFPEKGCHLGTNRSDNET